MKFLTLLFVLLTTVLSAQVKYGTITYLRTSEVNFEPNEDGPSPQDKQIKEMMAKMQASGAFNKTYKATFSPTAFNCVEEYKEPAEMTTETGGGMVISVVTGDEEPAHYYTGLSDGHVLNTDYIFDRKFLVSGQPEAIQWNLTGEKVSPGEMTAGLDLLLAKGVNSEGDTVVAGYAPSLPAQVGPLNYYGLPGAIITLEIPGEKSSTVYRATNIEVSAEPMEVSKPTEGKAISLKKFREQIKKRSRTMMREFRH